MKYILIIIVLAVLFFVGYFVGKYRTERKIPKERKDAIQRSRAVLSGQFSEQVAPYFPKFPGKISEARFIGKPIDFLVFKGMDEQNITEVVFVEVKTKKSSLSTSERRLRDTIKAKNVKWVEYRPDKETENLTKPPEK